MTKLIDAAVVIDDDSVTLTYRTNEPLPVTGHWLLSTTFSAGPEGPIHQLGLKVVDGRSAAVFEFDHVKVGQRNFEGIMPHTDGLTVEISYPRDVIGAVGPYRWEAALDLQGNGAGRVQGTL